MMFEVFDCIQCNAIPCVCAQQKAHCGALGCGICAQPASQDEAMIRDAALAAQSNPQPSHTDGDAYIYTAMNYPPVEAKCECGSEKVGSPMHSSYCPRFGG